MRLRMFFTEDTYMKKGLVIAGSILGALVLLGTCSKACEGVDLPSGGVSSTSSSAEDPNMLGAYRVEILSARLSTYLTKPIILIKYKFTNLSTETKSFGYAIEDYVYQDGVRLETSLGNLGDRYTEIKSGVTIDVEIGYYLNDTTTDVEVELTKWLASSNSKKVTKTFSLK